MKKQIKLVMAMFAVIFLSVTSAFAYSLNDLTDAASAGDIKKVKTIVNSGVNVNERDSDGAIALYRAAAANRTTVMKYLISKGASVDRTNKYGNTPISIAAYKGHLEAVKILVYNGCDVNAKDKNGVTPLQDAQKEGHTQVINFLKEQANKSASSSSSSSSSSAKADVHTFIVAAQNGNLDTVKKQVSLGVDINAIDNKLGWTALTVAAFKGQTEVVKYLISKGANLEKRYKNSETGEIMGTPLWIAARNGHLNCVKVLVEAKADINAKYGNGGSTPLGIATKQGKTEVVNYLKSKGAK